MKKIAVLGLTWGNEGKSKIIRFLATHNASAVVLCETNPSKSNILVDESQELEYTFLPSGVFNKRQNIISAGAFICPISLVDEISACGIEPEHLSVCQDAPILLSYHFGQTKTPQQLLFEDLLNGSAFFIRDLYDENFKKRLVSVVTEKNNSRKQLGQSLIDAEELLNNLFVASTLLKPYVTKKDESINHFLSPITKHLYYETRIGLLDSLPFGAYPNCRFLNNSLANISGFSKNSFSAVNDCFGVIRAFMIKDDNSVALPTLIQNETVYTFLKSQNIKENDFSSGLQIGWFDTVIARHLTKTLKIKKLCLTSLDKLSGLDRIKICISYSLDGEKIDYLPTSPRDIDRIVPNYIEVPGWKEELANYKNYRSLPQQVKDYIRKIEQYTKCKVIIVSFGNKDSQTIRKSVFSK